MSEQATEVAELLAKCASQNWNQHTPGVYTTVEEYTRQIVEQGQLLPDGEITAELSLTPRERITGTREQDMTAVFAIGVMVGSALERDIPKDSDAETVWRNGGFELPEINHE